MKVEVIDNRPSKIYLKDLDLGECFIHANDFSRVFMVIRNVYQPPPGHISALSFATSSTNHFPGGMEVLLLKDKHIELEVDEN